MFNLKSVGIVSVLIILFVVSWFSLASKSNDEVVVSGNYVDNTMLENYPCYETDNYLWSQNHKKVLMVKRF